MHIDKWVKASVVVAIVMGIPGWIGVFKPSSLAIEPSANTRTTTNPTAADPTATQSAPPEESVMQKFLAVMQYVGPILTSGFLLVAVVLAFRKRKDEPTSAEILKLRNELAEETNAKNSREGRLDELRKEYDQLKAKISTAARANPGFHLVSANWGNEHSSARLDDVINALPLNAVAFHLSPSTFKPYTTADKADPAFGSPKFLDIICSFPGQAVRKFRRYEGDIVVLPPDPRIFRELEEQVREISNLKAIKNAPRLLIKFSVDERSTLLFVNDDSPTLQSVELTDVKMQTQGPGKEERSEFNLTVNLHGNVGILRSGEQIDVGCQVRSGSTWMKMVDAIRKHSSVDKTTRASLAALYEDMEGNKFWRKFELSIDPLNRVAVTASPVMVAASEPLSWAAL